MAGEGCPRALTIRYSPIPIPSLCLLAFGKTKVIPALWRGRILTSPSHLGDLSGAPGGPGWRKTFARPRTRRGVLRVPAIRFMLKACLRHDGVRLPSCGAAQSVAPRNVRPEFPIMITPVIAGSAPHSKHDISRVPLSRHCRTCPPPLIRQWRDGTRVKVAALTPGRG